MTEITAKLETPPDIVVNLVESGVSGKSLEYTIDGNKLGIRLEGETEWQWMEFKQGDYEQLAKKPKINYIELVGNTKLKTLGVDTLENSDIDNLF